MYAKAEDKRNYDTAYRERNRLRLRAAGEANRRALKVEALNRYGNCCSECKIEDVRVLQIDHINNNGNEERKALGGQQVAGWRFYAWLKKQGWPDGYQTLCANHNLIKHFGDRFEAV